MSTLTSYASQSARDSAAPAASNTGLCIFRTDTKAIEVSDGTNYLRYNNDGISFAKGSTSADFGGTNEYVSIADSDTLSFGDGSTDSAFSLSAWINPDTVAGFRILSKSDASNAEYVWACDGGGDLRIWICDNNFSNYIGREDSSNSITTGWQHVVMTYDGSGSDTGIKLYRNKTQLSTVSTFAGSYTAMENHSMALEIGRLVLSGGSSVADGHMDDVAVIGKELTQTEINNIYDSNSYPSELVSIWRFEGDATDALGVNDGTGQNSVILNSTDVRS